MLRCGAGLITNSKATEHVLRRHAAARGLPMPPAVAAPLAAAMLPRGHDEPLLKEPYFVMLGTIEPRKNHALILTCWRILAEQWTSGPVPRLVLIGQRGWDVEHVGNLLNRCAVAQSLVIERSRCSDAELATWLRHARALLFPSFAEGYGLPLVEALAQGTPVIASDLPVFHEIAGDIPDYVNPLDGIGWLAAIKSFARDDSERRAAQLERARHFVPATWDEHFAMVDGLVSQLLGRDRA
jgi:glycosyltransferase involved in cell wall biosynthesis